MATVKKKAQAGYSIGSYATRDKATGNYDKLDRFKTAQGDRYYRSTGKDIYDLGKMNSRKALMNNADSVRSNTLSVQEKESMKSQENPMKKGGKMSKIKAKDGKWIQKAVNPKHKGYCTPMTKATCTPKRKALAKTFKAMGRARKGK
jgi:hypothetical protein